MFTGLVEEVGTVRKWQRSPAGYRLGIKAEIITADLSLGDSVCVDGVCLTVDEIINNVICFDVVADTLKDTTLSETRINDRMNLERALRADSRIGGHFVYGHVDGRAKIAKKTPRGLTIRTSEEICSFLMPKGSVAINGVSLTLQAVNPPEADIAVIPHTAENTNLSGLRMGDSVNIEVDFIMKQVITFIRKSSTGLIG